MTEKARELLESVVECWGIQAYPHDWEKLVREIRVFLSTPEPTQDEEPKTHEPWCAYLTQMLMSNPPQRSKCNCKNTTAPRPEFVRLSEEEIADVLNVDPMWFHLPDLNWNSGSLLEYARAIEDALERKNSPTIPSLNDTISANSRVSGHE